MKYRILYNPFAGGGRGLKVSETIAGYLPDGELKFCDMTRRIDYGEFFASLSPDETAVIAGGDGTLSHFVNDTLGIELPDSIMYYACGTGNDFLIDIGKSYPCPPFPIKKYIDTLPEITVQGQRRRFLNGVGGGLDGHVIAEVRRLQNLTGKKVSYTNIALKALLWQYKPVSAEITVDGVSRSYSRVWLAPTMQGRFFGGGMMIAPEQDRLNEDGTVTLLIAHGCGRLRLIPVFPEIFKGTHLRHGRIIETFRGHEITVKFGSPVFLQIDGETLTGVEEYTVRTAKVLGD